MPKNAPNPCCRDDANLGPEEDRHPGSATPPGATSPMDMESGFRRCTVCGARHFFMRPLPSGAVKVGGADGLSLTNSR